MKNLQLKRHLAKFYPAWHKAGRKIILLYHAIGENQWSISLKEFIDQIKWLQDHTRILPLSELLKTSNSQDMQVAITFDDGYYSLYTEIADLCVAKNIFPTLYINTGWIANNEFNRKKSAVELGHYPNELFLIWPEIKSLYEAGWEIGSHGKNHLDFTQYKNSVTLEELKVSKQQIEKKLHDKCVHFSYPWGKHNFKLREIVKSAGYQFAVAGSHGPVNNNSNKFALPRINIARNYTLEDFKNIVRGKWDYLKLIHKMKGL